MNVDEPGPAEPQLTDPPYSSTMDPKRARSLAAIGGAGLLTCATIFWASTQVSLQGEVPTNQVMATGESLLQHKTASMVFTYTQTRLSITYPVTLRSNQTALVEMAVDQVSRHIINPSYNDVISSLPSDNYLRNIPAVKALEHALWPMTASITAQTFTFDNDRKSQTKSGPLPVVFKWILEPTKEGGPQHVLLDIKNVIDPDGLVQMPRRPNDAITPTKPVPRPESSSSVFIGAAFPPVITVNNEALPFTSDFEIMLPIIVVSEYGIQRWVVNLILGALSLVSWILMLPWLVPAFTVMLLLAFPKLGRLIVRHGQAAQRPHDHSSPKWRPRSRSTRDP